MSRLLETVQPLWVLVAGMGAISILVVAAIILGAMGRRK